MTQVDSMTLRKWHVEMAMLALAILATAAIFELDGAARTLVSIVLLFVLPGRAFLAAWFPHRLAHAPDNVLLTVMLSIAIAVIGGLFLNLLPQGLQAQTWTLWLGGVTIFNGMVALLRAALQNEPVAAGQGLAFRPGQALPLLLAALVVVGAVVVARIGVLSQPRSGFTQLWIAPDTLPDRVQIGVENEEGSPMSYWLVVRQGATPLQSYYDVQVDADGTWSTSIDLPAGVTSIEQPIEALLYRADNPNTVYRSVNLWLTEVYPK